MTRSDLIRRCAPITRSDLIRRCAPILIALLAGCASRIDIGPAAPADAPNAGQLILPSGRVVTVYPQALRFSGRAEFRWPDGRSYRGTWLDGRPDGQGTELRPDGERYTGSWRRGVREGLGELESADGFYQGEFHNGRRSGRGVRVSAEGIYQGDWADDQPHGHGELAGAYGSHYSGEWRAGERAGQGAFRGTDGSAYQGEWLADRPDGSGVYRFPDGSVYQGNWRAGRQHGIGMFMARSGVVYEGEWRVARRDGIGTETKPDGSRYEGEWRDDRRHGQGRASWPDGSFHEGAWELNAPLGPGLRHYPAGIEVQGAWTVDLVASGLLSLPGGWVYAGPLLRDGPGRASPRLADWLASITAASPHASLLAASVRLDYLEPTPDPNVARSLLAQALDIPEAAFRLGLLLLESGAADRHEALTHLEAASRAGHAEAARVLGDLLASGDRIPSDPGKAADYYRMALRAGSPLAAERLARLLVTSEDPNFADPAEAIAVLEWVALDSGYWRDLDTLALAYAAAGDFEAAARTAADALTAAGVSAARGNTMPRPGTLVAANSPLATPISPHPDRGAMLERLARYQGEARRTEPAAPAAANADQQTVQPHSGDRND